MNDLMIRAMREPVRMEGGMMDGLQGGTAPELVRACTPLILGVTAILAVLRLFQSSSRGSFSLGGFSGSFERD